MGSILQVEGEKTATSINEWEKIETMKTPAPLFSSKIHRLTLDLL